MPKRILIFALTYLPLVGGAEVAIKEITKRLTPEDFEFDVITLRFDSNLPRTEPFGNGTIHRIGFTAPSPSMSDLLRPPLVFNKYLFPATAWSLAQKLHKQKKYDAIWSMMANYAGFAALFFKFSNPTVPFLLTLQEGDPIPYIKRRVRFVYPLYKMIFSRADMVQTISNYLADFARSMGFKKTLQVVPNGCDIDLFSKQYPTSELADLRNRLGKQKDDIFLITISRLVAKNAVDDSIRALKYLPDRVRLLVAGIGPDQLLMQSLVKELELERRVNFLGHVDALELPKYLKVSDIFVRPSLSEGMGNAFIEAMAAGLPVIATPVGGIVDFLFDPDKNPGSAPTGLFCNVRDPESIARQVTRLLTDEQLRITLCRNAAELVANRYGWDTVARAMRQNVFERLFSFSDLPRGRNVYAI